MPENARTNIYKRLHTALADRPQTPLNIPEQLPPSSRDDKVDRLTELMTSVRTEVIRVERARWPNALAEMVKAKKITSLLYGPETDLAAELEGARQNGTWDGDLLKPYDKRVESFKPDLFEMDAGITTTRGAIADRGALILWPTPQEPRLISLVPPIHIAILDADKIYRSMEEAISDQEWSKGMPTNVVFISGPSKTADIEFTLVFGVHGPRELVVIIRDN